MQDTMQGAAEVMGESLNPIPEVLKRLGNPGRSTFYQLVKDGHLRTVHIGRRTFVPSSEIDRYIASLKSEREVCDAD